MPYVYVMQANNVCKIGITSTSIIQRKKELQTGCPFPITKTWSSKDIENALEIEKILHNFFAGKRTCGEWFNEKFSTIVMKADQLVNNPHRLLADNKKLIEQNKELLKENKMLTKKIDELKAKLQTANVMNDYVPGKLYVSIQKASQFTGISEHNIMEMIRNKMLPTKTENSELFVDYKILMTKLNKSMVELTKGV